MVWHLTSIYRHVDFQTLAACKQFLTWRTFVWFISNMSYPMQSQNIGMVFLQYELANVSLNQYFVQTL